MFLCDGRHVTDICCLLQNQNRCNRSSFQRKVVISTFSQTAVVFTLIAIKNKGNLWP